MTVEDAWIQGEVGDTTAYPAQRDRKVLQAIWNEGVIRGCHVTASGADRVMTIATGQAAIQGDDTTNQGVYLATVTAADTVTLDAAPGANSRIDLVVLRVRDHVAGGQVGNDIIPDKVTGVVSGSPVPPAVPSSCLVLAQVLVGTGVTSIVQANVTDRRVQAGLKAPLGTIQHFYGPQAAIPNGWEVAQGQTFDSTNYRDLAALQGILSGSFAGPDLRGRVAVGVKVSDPTMDTAGETGGSSSVSLTEANLAPHSHVFNHGHVGTIAAESSHVHGSGSLGNASDVHHHSPASLSSILMFRVLGTAVGSYSAATGTGRDIEFVAGADVLTNDDSHTHDITGNTGAGTSHTHGLTITPTVGQATAVVGSGSSFSVMPPYVACWAIMCVK